MERRGHGNVSWERFEEQTKLAFVGDPLNSRFFLKTRATKSGIKVVSRVAHQAAKPTPASPRSAGGAEAVKYTTTDAANLSRLTRLLRFVMQEVLGPMKALPAATPLSPTAKPAAAPTSTVGKKESKKKKKAKK